MESHWIYGKEITARCYERYFQTSIMVGRAIFLNVRRCKNVLSEQNFIYVMAVRCTHL